MHLVATFRHNISNRETAERVRDLCRGGEELFDRAKLRPQDEVWWTETTNHIASLMIEDCEIRETSDANLAAKIPADAYRACYGQRDKDKVTQEHINRMRKGGAWVLTVGYLIRDTERIYLEGIAMGDRVIRARAGLRAFAWVIACETGLYKVVPDHGEQEEFEEDSETSSQNK